jgi:protein-ribulosamine 3-kinase
MKMLNGEYESSKIIYGLMDDFLPKPIGFGKYPNSPTYFYITEFIDMDIKTAPDPAEFTKRLAQLHRVRKSDRFGFHVPTCDGQVANIVDWQDNWATFFTKMLLGVCERDLATNGRWIEMERATVQVVHAVIPRLLGCLEIKPSIIHGDLWEGNVGIVKETGKSILFDAGSYYGHNESK